MNASFAKALSAAQEACADQDYPPSVLYVVATPIGNLADISLRALHVLGLADCVACEDTRHTQTLLRAYGIDKAPQQLLALHQHNEAEAAVSVVQRLQGGQRVAYVSYAGTPGISDPGARLVAAVQQAGLRASPLPGASSITTALSVSGISATDFVFAGFAPAKAQEREAQVVLWQQQARAVVMLEAPHRIDALAKSLAALGQRPVTVARELSKRFEEIATLAAQDFPAWLAANAQRQRGEFVVVLHPQATHVDAQDESLRVLQLLLAELPLKTAVGLTATVTGANRNALYSAALAWKAAQPASNAAVDPP